MIKALSQAAVPAVEFRPLTGMPLQRWHRTRFGQLHTAARISHQTAQ
jgi:hypothetical protein